MCSQSSSAVGGLGKMYDLLVEAGKEFPVDGNHDGSYLTMKSNQGIVFGVAVLVGGMLDNHSPRGKPFRKLMMASKLRCFECLL